MNAWNWLRENSAALQSVAALAVIISASFAGWSYVNRSYSPELTVRLNIDESTIPEDLTNFTKEVVLFLEWDKDKLLGAEDNPRIDSILNSSVIKRIQASPLTLDRAHIEVINNSEKIISGVRVRLDNIHSFWGIEVEGTFLDNAEASKFRDSLKDVHTNQSVILPELPPLPPNSSLSLSVFGSIGILKPFVTTDGQRYTMIEVVEVENGQIIEWYQKPWLLLTWLPIFVGALYIFLVLGWAALRRRVIENAKKNILYDTGCELAISGNADEAMVLLNEAVNSGYSNRQHALNDHDLESLRDRDDFIFLFKKGTNQ
ncbi:MAG: hypothetical protein JAZ17_11005 [Candidatus Thiodiazotropha endolucinida]|nr:hypothetical protein [Candidatus Thiodiazotropha endolucinida]